MMLHRLLSLTIFVMLTGAFSTAHSQSTTAATAQPTDQVYVIIQLKPLDPKLDSAAQKQSIKSAVDLVKQANTQLGYKELEKKIASVTLQENGEAVPYLSIRNFTDMQAAAEYAVKVKEHLPIRIYGTMSLPFPLSKSDYKKAMEQKDFKPYFQSFEQRKN
jgi:hypothetical protein